MIHPGDYLLPELGEELGRYAERKLRERKVEVIKGARVAGYDGWVVTLNNGISIPAATLIWTAGVKPSPVIAALPCPKEKGRICANEYLQVPGFTGLWTAGDCAAVPDSQTASPARTFYPPTAQHGMREAIAAAKNIERAILGRPLKPFRYRTMGMLASIGHHTGVASMFGFKFSGFIAWWMWRSVYLIKLPRLVKKLRVMIAWTLDLLFGRDIEQMITLRDVEELSERWARIRAERKPVIPSRLARKQNGHRCLTRQGRVAMDTTIVTALAGIVGSLCGGSASVATAWVTQKTLNKRQGIRAEVKKREALYGEFINECSQRVMDSLARNLDKPETLLSIYALLNRIRLCASDAVLAQAQEIAKFIMEQYFAPNVSVDEFHERVHNDGIDPLKAFSEACRLELMSMHAHV